MKTIVLATFAAALCSTAALAQDGPSVFSWAGSYAGVDAGVGFSNPGFSSPTGVSSGAFDDTAFVGGVYLGHDWQNGNFVYGGLLDFHYLGFDNQYGDAVNGKTTNAYNYDIDWVASARARGGYAVGDQVLLFGTAGLAVTNVQVSGTQSGFFGETSESTSKTVVGGVFSGGVEYAFTPKISVKTEYSHYIFGNVDVGGTTIPPATFKPRFGTLTVGLTYRF